MSRERTDSERLEFYFGHHLNNGGRRLWSIDSPVGCGWMLLLSRAAGPVDDPHFEWERLPGQYDTYREALDEAMNRSESIGYGPLDAEDSDA